MNPLQAGKTIQGDALRLLKEVPGDTFDTIFFDWPYSQASAVRGKDDGAAARIFGPVSRELRERNFLKIVSLAPEVL